MSRPPLGRGKFHIPPGWREVYRLKARDTYHAGVVAQYQLLGERHRVLVSIYWTLHYGFPHAFGRWTVDVRSKKKVGRGRWVDQEKETVKAQGGTLRTLVNRVLPAVDGKYRSVFEVLGSIENPKRPIAGLLGEGYEWRLEGCNYLTGGESGEECYGLSTVYVLEGISYSPERAVRDASRAAESRSGRMEVDPEQSIGMYEKGAGLLGQLADYWMQPVAPREVFKDVDEILLRVWKQGQRPLFKDNPRPRWRRRNPDEALDIAALLGENPQREMQQLLRRANRLVGWGEDDFATVDGAEAREDGLERLATRWRGLYEKASTPTVKRVAAYFHDGLYDLQDAASRAATYLALGRDRDLRRARESYRLYRQGLDRARRARGQNVPTR